MNSDAEKEVFLIMMEIFNHWETHPDDQPQKYCLECDRLLPIYFRTIEKEQSKLPRKCQPVLAYSLAMAEKLGLWNPPPPKK